MATSGSVDYSLTAREVINAALELLGVVSPGETPAAEDAALAQKHLNLLIKTWGTQAELFLEAEGSVTLSASTASYTASPVSLARRITGVRRRTSSIDTPLMPLSRQEYFDLPNKTTSGYPTCFYHDPQRSTRTLYVWPVPDSTIASSTTLRITYHRVLEDIDSLDDDHDFPQEWTEAVTYGLANRLSVPYRTHLTDPAGAQRIEQRAATLYAQLSADSEEDASVFMQPST